MGTPRIAKSCKNLFILAVILSIVAGLLLAMSPDFDLQFIQDVMSPNTTEMEIDADLINHKNVTHIEDVSHNQHTTQQHGANYQNTTPGAIHDLEYSHPMLWLDRSDNVHETYLLSAFWDDRQVEPYISNLVVMRTAVDLSDDVHMYCFIHCADANALNPQIFRANMTDIRTNQQYRDKLFDGTRFLRILIPCKPRACRKPEWVSVGYKMNSIGVMDRSNSVPVEYPSSGVQHDFGICVPPIFGCLNPYRVVEWMEMQKILGVGKVVIYNNSQCEETSRVLHEYGRQGLVEIRQDRVILNMTNPDDEETVRDELRSRSPLMMTDCMLRHMYDIKYTYSIDIDEVLVPQRVESLPEMVLQIEKHFNTTQYKQMTFTSYFILPDNLLVNKPVDNTFPNITHFLQYRKRLTPCDMNKRQKSIVWADRCGYRNNHICRVSFSPDVEYGDLYVPVDIAKVLHYRSKPCTVRNYGIRCRNDVPPKPVFNEDSMLRFKDKLLRNVQMQLKHLGMSMDEIE